MFADKKTNEKYMQLFKFLWIYLDIYAFISNLPWESTKTEKKSQVIDMGFEASLTMSSQLARTFRYLTNRDRPAEQLSSQSMDISKNFPISTLF